MTAGASTTLSPNLRALLERIAGEGYRHAAEGISGMMGKTVTASPASIQQVALRDIPALFGGPEAEAVGIYLRSEGLLAAQFLLVVPYQKALELADLLMDQPVGTTTQMGAMERSALSEVGNLSTAFFLNAVDTVIGLGARPTPPAVMVDMLGAIIDIVISTTGGSVETVSLLHSTLLQNGQDTQAEFWMIPDATTLAEFAIKTG
jgi:chemotaxis protein CheC